MESWESPKLLFQVQVLAGLPIRLIKERKEMGASREKHKAEFLGPDASKRHHHRRDVRRTVENPAVRQELNGGLKEVAGEIAEKEGSTVKESPGGVLILEPGEEKHD